MTANINPETGIPYGTIYLSRLADWVFNEFFYNGENLTYKAAWEEFLSEKESDFLNLQEEGSEEAEGCDTFADWKDENINDWEEEFNNLYMAEEEEYFLETDGMELLLTYLGGAGLVYVLKSPHTTQCGQCSPCVPNAGNLESEGSTLAYALPRDWFADSDFE